jgi:hypothetical protein
MSVGTRNIFQAEYFSNITEVGRIASPKCINFHLAVQETIA